MPAGPRRRVAATACVATANYTGASPLAARYRETYEKGIHLGRTYKDALSEKVRRIRERHGLASGAIEYRPELWVGDEQMALF